VAESQAVCDAVSECCDGAFARNVNQECDDGQFCTTGTTCQSDGTCGAGTPTDCAPAVTESACQAPTCDERNDRCGSTPRNEQGRCENVATARADHCENGQCVQDGCRCAGDNACCDGCNPRNAGGACDDGLYCTLDDTCNPQGACQGGPARDCAAAVTVPACQVAACDDVADACVARAARQGEACDDGLICTVATVCQPDGNCGGGGPRDCGGAVNFPTCQRAACTEQAGGCVAEPINIGSPCDDGLFCFDATTCQVDGRCAGGTARDCAAAQMDLACQAAGRCDEAADRCAADAVNENLPCDDGRLCTRGDRCVRGACAAGPVPACDAPGPCYAGGLCDEATGVCANDPLPDGTPCPLNNAQASCQGAVCVFSTCAPGFEDCNGDLADGCETPTADDVRNCGGCGVDCTAGGAYLNAAVGCATGICTFGGCASGFQDADADCAEDGPCANGCEVCDPLGDGTVDIPDDGLDNDCNGVDSTHSDARGWYVDASFRPAGLNACPDGSARGTAACPYTDLIDATLDLQAVPQDWARSDARRFVYIAGGRYTDPGTLLDIQQPLVIAGGYRRGAGNVWRRDVAGNPTVVEATAPGAAVAVIASGLNQVVIDGVQMTGVVRSASAIHLSRVTAGLLSVAADGQIRGSVRDSTLGRVDVEACFGCGLWKMLTVTIRPAGGDDANSVIGWGWEIVSATFEGGLTTADLFPSDPPIGNLRGSTFVGRVGLNEYSAYDSVFLNSARFSVNRCDGGQPAVERNQFTRHTGVYFIDNCGSRTIGRFADNRVSCADEGLSGYARAMVGNTITRCGLSLTPDAFSFNRWSHIDGIFLSTLEARAILGNRLDGGDLRVTTPDSFVSETIFRSNVVVGQLLMNNHSRNVALCLPLTVAGNTIQGNFVLEGHHECAARSMISSNTIVSNGLGAPSFSESFNDPTIFKNNAFVGFGDGPLYLNEGDTPLSRVAQVNALADLAACGRGGNIALATVDEARFLSLDPASPDFLRPGPGSPLLNAGLNLPYVCNNITYDDLVDPTDFDGVPRTCGATRDIGAYEACP
jgi:hypothetical protein